MKSKKKTGLSWGAIYTYGIGEFGSTFFISLVSYYLLFYMTDIARIPLAVAGILYSLLQWVEAFTAIGAGMLIDNKHFRSGRYRPWLLGGSILCMIGTVVFFTKFPVNSTATTVLFAVFYFVSYAGYNCMWIAYRALIGIIGRTSQETVSLTVSGTQLASVSSLIFSYLGVNLLNAFPNPETGYTVSALLYGGIMVLSMVAVFFLAKPYDRDQTLAQRTERSKEVITFRDMIRALPPLVPYGLSYILSIGASTLLFSCTQYYFKYTVGDETLQSTLITVMTVTRFAGTFIVPWLSGKMDKKNINIMSRVASAVLIALAYFCRGNLTVFFILIGLYSFVIVPGSAMFLPCVSDATDYNEYERGIKARSFLYSVSTTFSYIAQFVGATAASAGLIWVGYDAAIAAVSATTQEGIAIVTFLGTAALTALSVVPMLFYKLDGKTMESVYQKKEAARQEAEALAGD